MRALSIMIIIFNNLIFTCNFGVFWTTAIQKKITEKMFIRWIHEDLCRVTIESGLRKLMFVVIKNKRKISQPTSSSLISSTRNHWQCYIKREQQRLNTNIAPFHAKLFHLFFTIFGVSRPQHTTMMGNINNNKHQHVLWLHNSCYLYTSRPLHSLDSFNYNK